MASRAGWIGAPALFPGAPTTAAIWTPASSQGSQAAPSASSSSGRELRRDRSYEPRPGDLIFFGWDDEDEGQDGAADHVGIVEKVDGGIVYTVEGNSGDSYRENRYAIGHYEIYGYGTPTY